MIGHVPTAAPSVRTIGLTLALAGLMVTIDTTVALVAVPAIVDSFDVPLMAAQWVTTGYLLGVVGAIPIAAWTASRFGARKVYVAALIVFTLASAGVGLAWNASTLTGFRVLQGMGGGLLNPVGQAIGLRSVDRHSRGRLMSLIGLPVVMGPVLGPPLAGWLIDSGSWRWIFLINVPIGAIAVALCLVVIPQDVPTRSVRHVDWLGLLQLSGAAVLIVWGCSRASETDELYVNVVAPVVLGLAMTGMFVRRALRADLPLVDVGLVRHRQLRVGLLILAPFGAAYFGAGTILPIFVQGVRGDTATMAGVISLPAALGVGLTLQIATRLVDRVHPRRIVPIGVTVALAGGVSLLFAVGNGTSYGVIAVAALVLGIGSGATLMPTMTYAVRDLSDTETADGTTVLALVQQVSSAIGVAVTTSAFTVLIAHRIPALGDTQSRGLEAMIALTDDERSRFASDLSQAAGLTYLLTIVLLTASLLFAVVGFRRHRRRSD